MPVRNVGTPRKHVKRPVGNIGESKKPFSRTVRNVGKARQSRKPFTWPVGKTLVFFTRPVRNVFSAQAKVFVRKALPGDYRCFFLRGGGWGWELLLWEPWADSAHSNTSRRLGHRQLPSTQHALGLLLVPSFEAGLRLAPFAMHVPLACQQTPEKLWLRGLCRLCSAALRRMCSSVWTHVRGACV